MAGSSLLTLIDDIAAVLDDVAVMTKVAAKKTAGVLGDDLALNAEQVTVADRMELVLVRIKHKDNFLFSDLFESSTTITTIVATFLAILELTRLDKITLKQDRAFADIRCMRVETDVPAAPHFD